MADDSFTVEIEGLDELERNLDELGEKVARRGLRKALQAGGKVLENAMVALAPVASGRTPKGHEPGTLRDSIESKVAMSGSQEAGTFAAGPSKEAFYGKFSEFGTKHEPARPWVRPAFDASCQEALNTFIESLRESLNEAANKGNE